MNALDVARAALMEVGENPDAIHADANPLNPFGMLVDPTLVRDEWLVYRAGLLGISVIRGTAQLVACFECHMNFRHQTCTPLSDALTGQTCQ